MAASSSTALSTSANLNINSEYDVFINHRGPDVKKTFASHLYRALRSFGLNVFLDQQELQQGDYFAPQIEDAIRTASVHVAIFSKGYAESTWCLNELLSMLKSEAPIIPVFYQVKPSDLRWTQGNDGVYPQHLGRLANKRKRDPETHQETLRHNATTIEQWRNALSTVAGISGFALEACNGDEGELKDQVVECVLRKVKKTPLDVAKYPTGLEEKVTDFENKVLLPQQQHSGRKPNVVGIVGLGGAGKTTLVKELFNRKSSDYKGDCFLSEVRENVAKGSLILLQSKLLMCLTGSHHQIDNKDAGIEKLRKHFSSSPILLILDDVDSVDQVDALVPNQSVIHPNSLVLITSRNEDVLTNWGVEKSSIYKLTGLNKQHSLELFCWHAFNQADPLPGFDYLAYEFLKSCDGLPLSLKVFGALLRGNEDTVYWYEQLDRLKSIIPSEIQARLLISYEALNREEKHMFLGISCFFIGEDRDKVIRIWNGSGWKGWLGFRSLQNRCLVEVDRWNKIQMHDHLRDVGRDVAKESSPRRLWRLTEEVVDDLFGQSSAIIVRGIRIYNDNDVFSVIGMRRLQLLDTRGALLDRIMRRVELPNLIWLRCYNCLYSSLPFGIPIKNLRVLEVYSCNKLETLWQENSQLPECLEELRIHRCWTLKSIPGLQRLTRLGVLDISYCNDLEELPSVETLVSLESLTAGLSPNLKSIPGLAQGTKLRDLYISWCSQLEELPSVKTLVYLESLTVSGCVKLKSIPGLAQATKLRVLDISECSELEELPSVETLVYLESLTARGCVKLKSILGFVQATKLRVLDISGCSELEELPNVETLVYLESLRAPRCLNLKSIPGLAQATKLRVLDISWCSKLEELPSVETLISLKNLTVEHCVNLKSIRGLASTKVRHLDISGCSKLEELLSVETLVSLEARGCVKLKRIPGLAQATKLRVLNISGCCEFEELSVETLISLVELSVKNCVKLKSIPGLAQAKKLERLFIDYLPS